MNSLKQEISGRYVVLKREYYKGDDPIERVFLCEGGFGCSDYTMGTAVIGIFVNDGSRHRVEGSEIERFATVEEVEEVEEAKKRLSESGIGMNI